MSATVVASVALVVVTFPMAVSMWRTVTEMKTSRLLSIRPRVGLGVKNYGAGIGFVTVTNIGQGAAVNLKATLTYEGRGESREIAYHLLSVGETNEYIPKDANNSFVRMDELTTDCKHVTLVGSMEDALGSRHHINERIDLWRVWEITKTALRRLPPDHAKQNADSIKDIKDELRKLNGLAQSTYYRLWPPNLGNEEEDEAA